MHIEQFFNGLKEKASYQDLIVLIFLLLPDKLSQRIQCCSVASRWKLSHVRSGAEPCHKQCTPYLIWVRLDKTYQCFKINKLDIFSPPKTKEGLNHII